ncbi:MAG: hypothetical protein FJ206_12875 [Gemmatimonadetes bacterium]|nr:hypothetical protein [Gemmatimonadota bacterium]
MPNRREPKEARSKTEGVSVTPNDAPSGDFEPKHPGLVAFLICLAAVIPYCWPMATGQFLAGPASDQFIAGYSFRHFAAEYFRDHGSIPLWNPYLFGGMPFVGAAHGDIFYPTAALRWILPTDVAMNLGFGIHIVLAGVATYALFRALRISWGGAIVGGLTYQLSGIVLSQVHPGHDGKLFVSMLAPLLFLGILRAVRDRDGLGYGIMALATGLSLQGHPQASQYLLIAGAIWGAWWTFGSEGPKGTERWRIVGMAAVAMAVGVGLYAIYALPMLEYVPYSPRADGGVSSGWEHATSYALPLNEVLGVLLPKIDGGAHGYFGRNGIRHHADYLGATAVILAIGGLVGTERRTARWAMVTVGIVFMLVSLGGATPFFKLWFELVPMAKRLRAPGMAFFLVALPVAYFAAAGTERLLRSAFSTTRLWGTTAVVGGLGLVAMVGGLQFVSEDIARTPGYQGFLEMAIANRPALETDGLRLLLTTLAAAAVVFLVSRRTLSGGLAIGSLVLVGAVEQWTVLRSYFVFSPGAAISYGADPITTRMKEAPLPFRVFAPEGPLGQLNPYRGARLMAEGIPAMFGYHGNELSNYDNLLGGKGRWQNQVNPNIWQMLGVRFAVLNQPQELPGFRQLLGPIETRGGPAYLYEADTVPPYVRVVRGAAKLPENQLAATAADPRFPFDRLAIFADTASLTPAPLEQQIPERSALLARVTKWEAGRIEVAIDGRSDQPEYLIVAENWYRDWTATVDGTSVPVHRAQNTLLSVEIPPGAAQVVFEYRSKTYQRGRLISLTALAGLGALFAVPLVRRRSGRP